MNLGSLDLSIYRCISSEITTAQVIITEAQIQHIAAHHPDAFSEIIPLLAATLSHPDYILKDSHHIHSGLVVRVIPTQNSSVCLVLRIHTATDRNDRKNTVISAWKISSKRLKNYLRNYTILYKRPDI